MKPSNRPSRPLNVFRSSAALFSLLAASGLLAQHSPYPGGYPGQQGGMGLPRLPIPGRKKSKDPAKPDPKKPMLQFTGVLREKKTDFFVIEADDTRLLEFHASKSTRYLREEKPYSLTELKPGDQLYIEAQQNDDGEFFAATVTLKKRPTEVTEARPDTPKPDAAKSEIQKPEDVEKPKAAETKPGLAKAETPNAAPAEADDPGSPATYVKPQDAAADEGEKPRLKRGKPAPRKTDTEEAGEPVQVAVATPPPTAGPTGGLRGEAAPPPANDRGFIPPSISDARTPEQAPRRQDPATPEDLIEQVRESSMQFTESLPNYLVQQMTTRFQSETRNPSWTPIDTVSADVVYDNGKESYKNLKVNNKAVKKDISEIGGSWSTGEFASTLQDVFSRATNADFRYISNDTSSGVPTKMYNFTVEQPNSHWHVKMAGQSVFPAYRGSVWIDPKTARVMRIEMQARRIPGSFPLDTVEWVVEYAPVRIGSQPYILPVHAENLACWRGSFRCSKNTIDFRNYRKFTSESQIFTSDTNINFEGAGEPPDAKTDDKKPAPKKKQ